MLKYSYAYDNLNQLVRENNAVSNKTYVYTYDDAGNILTKKTYAYTTGTLGSVQLAYNYTYGNSNWGDQLTAYRGTSLTYDALGNPLSYYNGSSYTFEWTNGRQLASSVRSGTTTTYTYNADGIRTGKTVGGSVVEYILDGTKILAEQNGTHSIRYYYDPQGLPVGMNFDGTVYLYEKNLQGDVIGIYTTSGTKIATYVYDAWGKIVSSTYTSGYYDPFYYNPFRYRGYYYDTETGFYYLQSRYYDPATGRFLNADGYINANGDLQGFNMYTYCSNNPVMNVDYTGEGFLKDLWNEIDKTITDGVNGLIDLIEYSWEAAQSNLTLEFAVGFGMYYQNDYFEIGFRMDVIAIEFSENEWKIGHDGRAAFTVSSTMGSIGPQSDTYETFDGERSTSGVYYENLDAAIGTSRAAYFVGGGRINVSFSYIGYLEDMLNYISERLF